VKSKVELTAKIERFDSFWGGTKDVEKGYDLFCKFYKSNYREYAPNNRESRILVISCGPGYFVNLLKKEGYSNVLGIDSDPNKVKFAVQKGLNCKTEYAFEFLGINKNQFDVIVAEQEINHLTKEEILRFLKLCWNNLNENGTLIVHSLNGANPITGAEALAQNFDHFNTFTEYSLRQILQHANFCAIKIIPLNLYVFYTNPLNYIGMLFEKFNSLFFRLNFILYGKSDRIFTKKIAAICRKG
jgi:2-polyprenyl-3-methyl-5-hydroxy-6-metoxy-1,4-benzoquinol methylase